MSRASLSAFLMLILSACSHGPALPEGAVNRLEAWLSGSFSSAAQAARDASYFDVRLHVVPIWTTRTDGPWLYVEQALGTQLDKPYRQRVYQLRALGGGRLESRVFELPQPEAAVGAWRSGASFPLADPTSLLPREGCVVVLRDEGERFVGSTNGKDCSSSLRGASYATSEVTLDANAIHSWDRGYDSAGQQVWGATGGAYEFVRQPN